ncbi:MAG: hypothetical protein IJL17_17390 [Kiritimatiellae bacterium]|nr:hypothetical protein [Kiritimatiellia bacterium]
MSAETMKRDRVFLRFEDADYYYRSTAVEAVRRKINAAEQAKDELAAVRAYEELGTLLSAGRDVTWRRKFFNDCLRPMSDVIISEKVRGYLHDLLGRQAFDIGMADYIGYFERAVELGNDSVFDKEEVLRAHPEIIIRWIKCYLLKSARDAKVEGREALLDRIVATRDDASEYYLGLADVLKDRYRPAADRYYRKCIRLGCGHVVDREEFLSGAYEADYIEWFKSLCASGVKPAEAAERCFSRLWKACTGSESHREYADSLWRSGAKRDAVVEYVRGAEAKFNWAEQWLHAHSSEQMVYEGLSDALVDFWFKDCEKSLDRQKTLGRCFDHGGGLKYRKDSKYFACVARCRLGDGDILGAVRTCIGMDNEKQGRVRDFMEQTALDGFQDLRRDLREALRKDVGSLVGKEMSSKEYDNVVIEPDLNNLRSDALPPEDLRSLREYVRSGALEISPFRMTGEKPLCSRYMLLDFMEKMFAGESGPLMTARTMRFLKEHFGKLADREFRDSVDQGNPMTTCKWLIHHLFTLKDSSERKEGEAALYRMVSKWQRGDDELPIKLLVSYWKSIGRDSGYMLALRIFFDNDRELRKWVEASDANTLFGLAYETVANAARG